MSDWKPNFVPEHLYFITTSTHNHRPTFRDKVTNQIILDIFDCYRRQNQFILFSFVIMPTHIHFISQFTEEIPLPDFMRNLKSLSADRIQRYFRSTKQISKHSLEKGKIENSKLRTWESGYIAKEIFSLSFLEQKFNYIHQNPCRSPWMLVHNPEDYPWSSARFYITTEPCIIPIDDIRTFLVNGSNKP